MREPPYILRPQVRCEPAPGPLRPLPAPPRPRRCAGSQLCPVLGPVRHHPALQDFLGGSPGPPVFNCRATGVLGPVRLGCTGASTGHSCDPAHRQPPFRVPAPSPPRWAGFPGCGPRPTWGRGWRASRMGVGACSVNARRSWRGAPGPGVRARMMGGPRGATVRGARGHSCAPALLRLKRARPGDRGFDWGVRVGPRAVNTPVQPLR
jgi:hypothetical protein